MAAVGQQVAAADLVAVVARARRHEQALVHAPGILEIEGMGGGVGREVRAERVRRVPEAARVEAARRHRRCAAIGRVIGVPEVDGGGFPAGHDLVGAGLPARLQAVRGLLLVVADADVVAALHHVAHGVVGVRLDIAPVATRREVSQFVADLQVRRRLPVQARDGLVVDETQHGVAGIVVLVAQPFGQAAVHQRRAEVADRLLFGMIELGVQGHARRQGRRHAGQDLAVAGFAAVDEAVAATGVGIDAEGALLAQRTGGADAGA